MRSTKGGVIISRSIAARFLAIFLPAFVVLTALCLYLIAERHIGAVSDQLGARIGTKVARTSALITPGLWADNPNLVAKLLGTLLSDPAVTCVDTTVSGVVVRKLSQPRNLGCTIMRPERSVGIDVANVKDLKLVVGFSQAELTTLRNDAHKLVLTTTIIATLLSMLICWLAFQSSIGKPIAQLVSAIRASQGGKFCRVPVSRKDEVSVLCSAFNDMQDRIQEERLRTTAALKYLDMVYNETPALLFTMNSARIITSVSDFWVRASGYSREEVLGQPLATLVCAASAEVLKEIKLANLIPTKSIHDLSLCFHHKNGCPVHVLLSITTDRRDDGQSRRYVCVMNDVTQLRRTEQELRSLAVTDQLTKLYNRRGVMEYFDTLASSPDTLHSCAVLFIDIDNFKTINDTLGHEAGDQILRCSAARIQAVVGEAGVVGRIGGDEFTIILPKATGLEQAEGIAALVIDQLNQPIAIGAHSGHVGASVGIVMCDAATTCAADALRLSDQAMYLAKSEGKNRYSVYQTEKASGVRDRAKQIQFIRGGTENSYFDIHFQPIVDLNTMQPYAVEAVLRVTEPGAPVTSIRELITLAEEIGHMTQLGEMLLEMAIEKFVSLTQAVGCNELSLSINLSPVQLATKLIEDTRHQLQFHPELANRLIFEITETNAIEQFDLTVGLLGELRSLGVQIAIDDFGSGYSSLTYLDRLPVDILKLDKSFGSHGTDTGEMGSNNALIQSVVGLASALGLTVVAEGLESEASVDGFRTAGVQLGQGYCIATPMSAAETENWIRHSRTQDGRGVAVMSEKLIS